MSLDGDMRIWTFSSMGGDSNLSMKFSWTGDRAWELDEHLEMTPAERNRRRRLFVHRSDGIPEGDSVFRTAEWCFTRRIDGLGDVAVPLSVLGVRPVNVLQLEVIGGLDPCLTTTRWTLTAWHHTRGETPSPMASPTILARC